MRPSTPGTKARGPRTLCIALLSLAVWLLPLAAAARAAEPAVPAATAAAAPATADPCAVEGKSEYLAANASEAGTIRLLFFDAEGSPVEFSECVGERVERVGTVVAAPNTMTELTAAWSCVRTVRRFVAVATLPSGRRAVGSFSVRTPSCAQRFELRAPARVKPGSVGRIRVVDRWGIGGIRTRLCLTAPGARRSCRTLAFPRAVTVASRRFRASSRGRWRVELQVRSHRVRTAVAVGGDRVAAPRPLPTLLATGDSTMQGIDSFLADDLVESAVVRSDVRPGTGISKLNPWALIAAQDVKRLHPTVTVISIGANDAWPMTTAAGATVTCCTEPWIAEYAARVRSMMATYARRGRGRVLWLTLPVPRDLRRVPIFAAVNRAVLRAAAGAAGVTVLRMDLLFSPSGGYQEVISHRGHDVDVREPDGIHLNVSGAAIAAAVIKQILTRS